MPLPWLEMRHFSRFDLSSTAYAAVGLCHDYTFFIISPQRNEKKSRSTWKIDEILTEIFKLWKSVKIFLLPSGLLAWICQTNKQWRDFEDESASNCLSHTALSVIVVPQTQQDWKEWNCTIFPHEVVEARECAAFFFL